MSNAGQYFVCGLLVLLSLLIVAGCRDDSRRVGGPLGDTTDGRSGASAPVKRGQFLVVGVFTRKNGGSEDAVLESLEPREPERAQGLEMRYAAVPAKNRGCHVGAARDWPPLGCASQMRPVRGFRVPSGEVALILVGARSQDLGRWLLPAFRLRYSVGSDRYETTYSQGLGMRVVRRLAFPKSSASFSSFQTEALNIGCAYTRSNGFLRCAIRSGVCYEMKVTGPRALPVPEPTCSIHPPAS